MPSAGRTADPVVSGATAATSSSTRAVRDDAGRTIGSPMERPVDGERVADDATPAALVRSSASPVLGPGDSRRAERYGGGVSARASGKM